MHADIRRLLSISTLAAGMALAAGAGPAAAQPAPGADPSVLELGRKVRPGDRLTVTTRDLARIRGKLVAVGDDGLVLATDSGRQQVALSDLDRVSRRRHGMLLGPIIGAGAGIGFAIPVAMLYQNEGADATVPAAFLIGLGAGIGLLIDAAIDLPRTVYRRDTQPKVTVAPQIGPRSRGVVMHVTF